MAKIEFFFDCSSPWTYLAFEQIQALIARHPDVEIVYRPILVGGVFNAVNPSVYVNRDNPVPPKQAYAKKDLQDWAASVGVTIGEPPVFPVNSVKAMRGAFVALEQGCLVPYARRVFERYWEDLADISQVEELAEIVRSVGMDETVFFEKIANPEIKDQLRAATEELIARGGFGSPTLYLEGDDMYFGNDRICLIEAKLAGAAT